jgi:hypothetical protein
MVAATVGFLRLDWRQRRFSRFGVPGSAFLS